MDWNDDDARERREQRSAHRHDKKKHGPTLTSRKRRPEHRRHGRDPAAQASAEDPSAAGHRHGRLEKLLTEELRGLLGDELADPEAQGLAVVRVSLSVDYRHARVAVRAPELHGERALRALERAAPWLRGRLGEALDTKILPMLRFALATQGELEELATAEVER